MIERAVDGNLPVKDLGQAMISRTLSIHCRSCGGPAVRVAQYSPYRSRQVTSRYRCRACGQVFEEVRVEPLKRGNPENRLDSLERCLTV
jgi:transposase-like protein